MNDNPINRRDFAVTTLTAGFALAAQPVSAEPITTDDKGLTAGEVKIPVKDGTVPAYRAWSERGSCWRSGWRDTPPLLLWPRFLPGRPRRGCRRF